jgi:hypothetical protein
MRYILLFMAGALLLAGCASEGGGSTGACLDSCGSKFEGSSALLLSCKASCHTGAAKKSGDAALCGPILSEDGSMVYYQLCLEGVAVAHRDPSPCDRLNGTDRVGCLTDVAGQLRDASVCDGISEQLGYQSQKQDCILRAR